MEIGTRVKIVKDVDNYPTIFLKAGETGTLKYVGTEGQYYIELDEPHEELAEWDNQIEIWDYSEQSADYHPLTYLEKI